MQNSLVLSSWHTPMHGLLISSAGVLKAYFLRVVFYSLLFSRIGTENQLVT